MNEEDIKMDAMIHIKSGLNKIRELLNALEAEIDDEFYKGNGIVSGFALIKFFNGFDDFYEKEVEHLEKKGLIKKSPHNN